MLVKTQEVPWAFQSLNGNANVISETLSTSAFFKLHLICVVYRKLEWFKSISHSKWNGRTWADHYCLNHSVSRKLKLLCQAMKTLFNIQASQLQSIENYNKEWRKEFNIKYHTLQVIIRINFLLTSRGWIYQLQQTRGSL